MHQSTRFSFLLATLSFQVFSGCANDASCDPGERFKSGLCLPGGSGAKAKPPEPDGGSLGPDGGRPAGTPGVFGADCLTNSDCGDPAPVCAIQPTDAKGFCTQIDCATNPSVCPAGWQCFDASVINPDYPAVCVSAN